MKKKIIFLIAFLMIPMVCLGASNPYPKTQNFNGYTSTPCTRVAWQEAYDRLGIALPGWGNAVDWYRNAANAGYQVGSEAKPNSIAVYSGFYDYGHVAFVIEVSDETMRVVENKGSSEGKTEGTRSKGIGSGEESGLYLIGFIYITEPKTSTGTTTTTTTTTTTKSSNSALKKLEVKDYDLNFQKDNYYYELTVPYEKENVSINATLDSSKASLKYDKEPTLKVGDNILEIKVTAEDKSQSVYILNIIREEKKENQDVNEVVNEEETKEKEPVKNEIEDNKLKEEKSFKWSNYYLIPIISVPILVGIITLLVVKRKKK